MMVVMAVTMNMVMAPAMTAKETTHNLYASTK